MTNENGKKKKKMSWKKRFILTGVYAAIFFIAFLFLFGFGPIFDLMSHLDRDEYVGTVTKAERVQVKKGEKSRYLVFIRLEDGEIWTMENTDSLLEWKNNSGDLHGAIIPGKKYRFKTYGWRFRSRSIYENIVSVEEIKPKAVE